MSKSIVRSIKNVANGYTSAQVKVRNGECPFLLSTTYSIANTCFLFFVWIATSNDVSGPTTWEMEEISYMTNEQ
mgnify:CR=1 FL=1